MITEQEFINELYLLNSKLSLLIANRKNNKEFWENIQKKFNEIIKEITTDKKIYRW